MILGSLWLIVKDIPFVFLDVVDIPVDKVEEVRSFIFNICSKDPSSCQLKLSYVIESQKTDIKGIFRNSEFLLLILGSQGLHNSESLVGNLNLGRVITLVSIEQNDLL